MLIKVSEYDPSLQEIPTVASLPRNDTETGSLGATVLPLYEFQVMGFHTQSKCQRSVEGPEGWYSTDAVRDALAAGPARQNAEQSKRPVEGPKGWYSTDAVRDALAAGPARIYLPLRQKKEAHYAAGIVFTANAGPAGAGI